MADVFKFTEDQRTALNIVPSIQSIKTRKLKCDPDIHSIQSMKTRKLKCDPDIHS